VDKVLVKVKLTHFVLEAAVLMAGLVAMAQPITLRTNLFA